MLPGMCAPYAEWKENSVGVRNSFGVGSNSLLLHLITSVRWDREVTPFP